MSSRARSSKTTIAGILAGLALVLTAVSDAMLATDGEWGPHQIGTVVAGLAVGLQGLFSRDDDVTSEGTKRPKT